MIKSIATLQLIRLKIQLFDNRVEGRDSKRVSKAGALLLGNIWFEFFYLHGLDTQLQQ